MGKSSLTSLVVNTKPKHMVKNAREEKSDVPKDFFFEKKNPKLTHVTK